MLADYHVDLYDELLGSVGVGAVREYRWGCAMASKFLRTRKVPADVALRTRKRFNQAVQLLAFQLGLPQVNVAGTPASILRSRCTTVLRRVSGGRIEVLTQSGEPFVVLSLKYIAALIGHQESGAGN